MPETLITSNKRKQIIRLLEDGLDKMDLDDLSAQRVIERGGELQDSLRQLLMELSVSDRFADEEVGSSYGYLSGYTVPLPLAEQAQRLRELFPELAEATFDESIATKEAPMGCEGYFAIPHWQILAPTYGEAVQKVFDVIKQTRDGKFYSYREGQLGSQYLRQHTHTVEQLQQLAEQQLGHEILAVPAQFGIRHRGRSVRRAREVMVANEFGLGTFHVGIMLLTHPKRLQHFDDLWVDCSGGDFSPDADGVFGRAPCFSFGVGEVGFGTRPVDDARVLYGSVSGFLPQS